MNTNWIPVTESLPDADTTVLVSCPAESETVWLGYLDGESDQWRMIEGMPVEVTHWQHPPEAPKGIKKAKPRRAKRARN